MRNFKKLIAVVSALALLLTVFSGINMFASADYVADPAKELADFKAAMETKATLTPGTYVEAGDTEYYHGMLRTREGPNGTWDPAFENYTAVAEMPVGHWDMACPAGSLFGLVVNKTITYTSNDIWFGASTVYNVVPGTYVAAVVNANTDATYADGTFASKFRYETSADGETWTALTATIKEVHSWTTNHSQASYAIAIVQIPEGAKYYRITMAGFDEAKITNALKDDGLWSDSGYDNTANGVPGFSPGFRGYGIASVIASACDLTAVTNYTEITDYTHVSSEVRAFQKEMAKKATLSAGVYDDLSTTDYHYVMNRGLSNWPANNSAPGVDGYFPLKSKDVPGTACSQPLGTIFGVENMYARLKVGSWDAYFPGAVCYNVNAGDYVATAVLAAIDHPNEQEIFENEFSYQVSANGQVWVNIDATVIDVCENWNERNNQLGFGTAVVQIPEGMKYYRITPAGPVQSVLGTTLTTKENAWQNYNGGAFPTDGAYSTSYGVAGSIASTTNLALCDSIDDIPDVTIPTEFDKKMADVVTLTAGTTIEADTVNGYKGMVRTIDIQNAPVSDPYAAYTTWTTVSEFTALDWGYSHLIGGFFGKPQTKVLTYNGQENHIGAANIYKVVPGTYVAAFVTMNMDKYTTYTNPFVNNFCYDVSKDGTTWTRVTPTIKDEHPWTGGYCQVAHATAVVQIPENANYYRITMAGYNPGELQDAFVGGALWNEAGYDVNGVGGFNNGYHFSGIGAVMASDKDLTDIAEFDENGAAKYDVVVPTGVATSTNAVKKDDVVTVNIDQTEKFLVAGSLKVNGVSIFAKADTDVPGEGSGTSFKFTVDKDGKAEVTATFKDFADVEAKDNFATIAASKNVEASAIRFLTRQYLEEGKIRIGENLYDVVLSGTVFLPTDMLKGAELTVDTENAVNVEVRYLYDKTAKYIDHACGIKNLTESLKDREITARAYVAYIDAEGATAYAYADTVAASFNGLK